MKPLRPTYIYLSIYIYIYNHALSACCLSTILRKGLEMNDCDCCTMRLSGLRMCVGCNSKEATFHIQALGLCSPHLLPNSQRLPWTLPVNTVTKPPVVTMHSCTKPRIPSKPPLFGDPQTACSGPLPQPGLLPGSLGHSLAVPLRGCRGLGELSIEGSRVFVQLQGSL